MKRLDAVAGEFQCVQRRAVAGFHRRVDLGRGDAQGGGIERKPVEFCRCFEQRGIAAGGDVLDDGARLRLNIGRDFALGGEENIEFFCK